MPADPVASYLLALTANEQRVRTVGDDLWAGPTPCTEWSVHDLVNHLVSEHHWAKELLSGRTIDDVGDRFEGDLLGDDPVRAFEESVRVARAAVQVPGAMAATCHLSFGDTPAPEYVGQLLVDEVVHGWDLAVATGQDAALDPILVAVCWEGLQPAREMIRASGVFGEEIDVSLQASLQTRLLGLLGRRG
jgi:uncharacterized protein (TIGR03086 family)